MEVAAAGYGQGITTTPIQHLQALTMIANDGIANIIRDSYRHITTFVVDHNSNIARDNMNGVANAANPINVNRNDALQQTLNIVNIKCAAVNPAQH